MKTSQTQSLRTVLVSAALTLVALQGCGDDGNDNATPPDVSSGARNSAAGGDSARSNAQGGEDKGQGGQGGDGNTGNQGGGGRQLPQPECDLPELGENGCFNCPENGETEQWLNRCAEGDCEPFDNAARLPLLNNDGSVPDLP
jgi:hypothetical protein